MEKKWKPAVEKNTGKGVEVAGRYGLVTAAETRKKCRSAPWRCHGGIVGQSILYREQQMQRLQVGRGLPGVTKER